MEGDCCLPYVSGVCNNNILCLFIYQTKEANTLLGYMCYAYGLYIYSKWQLQLVIPYISK